MVKRMAKKTVYHYHSAEHVSSVNLSGNDEIVLKLSARTGWTTDQTEEFISLFFEEIKIALQTGYTVKLSNFGAWQMLVNKVKFLPYNKLISNMKNE